MIYDIVPNTKPRMTQRDKWQKRPCVLKYRAFKDEVRLKKVELPEDGFAVIFTIPMPKSWSKTKKEMMNGQPHKNTPDSDNLVKALFDSIYSDDSHLWNFHVQKLWGIRGSIEIYAI